MKERILFAALICLMMIAGLAPGARAELAVADWTLNTADGGTVNFHETLAKGPVVMNFWATWCKPCLKEMPHLNKMAAEYDGRITFLAVNTDNSKSVAKVAPVLKAKGFDNLVVPLDTGAEVASQLQVAGIVPFLVVIDQHGREVYRHVGYKEGDEEELAHFLTELMAHPAEDAVDNASGKPQWAEAVNATNKFEYSYSTESEKEIMENWLDVSYQFGGFRTGLMLNSQAPSEENNRGNEVKHRFFEFDSADFSVRAGHFHGLFGRGLVFNSYEDRTIRIDTRLDGVIATGRKGPYTATVFSGSPSVRELDIRGADLEVNVWDDLFLGGSALTYRSDNGPSGLTEVFREWVWSLRARHNFGFGDLYFERGQKTGYDFDRLTDEADEGQAIYANLNLYQGPLSVSWEHMHYKRFAVVAAADGKTTLNRPPSLAREFAWTMLNRSPHDMDANDEKGNNLDVIFSDGGWTLVASGAQLKNLDDETAYELAFGSIQKSKIGPFRPTVGFAYQDNKGLHQTIVGELSWMIDDSRTLTLQAEHQHVRLGGGHGYDLGAYDVEWFKLEYELAPKWAFAGIFETNNKYDEQRSSTEDEGPFPSGQITYTLDDGGNLNLWFGSRQAGYVCSGGVCKYEPAFEGLEFFGVFRY